MCATIALASSPIPVIQCFSNCRVAINPRDHAPPHFHVVLNEGREAWVAIATLEILHGKVAAREIQTS
ncbi:MAG: DUF4160 domain-containing protein [Pseudomonadota bacterium]|nr:DUF4160 domain-containing protein [Pseudomonadota bacterium]MDP1572893.1 DUF4160 domain-containing protein [Pseudomonadota bacterium]MDP1906129.1 DUF4160 domain-containing protein [Pseudomonadota bacterium]